MTAAIGLRTLIQTAVFLIVARVLSVADYGAYSAVLALAGALSSFTGFGTHTLLVRDIARNPDAFASAWGRTLAAISLSAPVLFLGYLALAWVALPPSIPFSATVLIGISEIIFAPMTLAAVNAYQGHERIGHAARMIIIPVLPRLVGALALAPLTHDLPADVRLPTWAALYAVATLAAAVFSRLLVRRDLGLPDKSTWAAIRGGLCEGLPLAFGGAALKLYADIDKTMLARLATLEVAGAYSASYRMVDIATVPVFSLLIVATPRFFRSGEGSIREALRYAWRVIPIPLAYALFAGIALFVAADYLPFLLGESYSDAVSVLRWLAWLPVVSMPRLFLQTALVGGDHQMQAVAILSFGAVLNIALNVLTIPLWGWRGAVAATYAAEIVMAFAMLLVAWRRSNH